LEDCIDETCTFATADSGIDAFDPMTGAFLGSIPIDVGDGNTPGGLWALSFGDGGSGGSPNVLYFTDGINAEGDGLFGALAMLGLRARKRYQG
jgi:hypothetical protein